MQLATSIVGATVALCFLAGCGQEHPSATHSGTAARTTARPTPVAHGDRALVASALVQRTDFSEQWEESSVPAPDLRCSSAPFRTAASSAASHRLQLQDTTFQELVGVFGTPAASRAAYARLNSPASMACLRHNARVRMSERTEGEASRPELVRAEPVGRWGKAVRLRATGPSQVGVVHGTIDAVHVRVGRALGALMIVSGPAAVSETRYEQIVAAFTRRLHDALR